MKKLKQIFNDVILISKLTKVTKKKLRLLLSVVLSNVTVFADILIILVFANLLSGENSVNLKLLMKKLSTKKIETILVEGGGTVNWEFIKNNIFDELIITLSPYLIGGNDATSLVEGKGFSKIVNSPNLKLKSVKRLKNHLVINYIKV